MITLNLLPIKEGLKHKKQLKQFMLFLVVIILIIAGNVVFYLHHSTLVEQQRLKVNKLSKDVKQYKDLLGDIKKENKKREDFLRRIDAIHSLEKLKKNLLKTLDEINKQIPDKTWLTVLNKKGNKIELIGGAASYDNVTRFVASLMGQGNTFSKVEIKEIHSETYNGKVKQGKYSQALKYIAFKLDCVLKERKNNE